MGDAAPHLARFGIARYDGDAAGGDFGEGAFRHIEPQARLARGLVWPVAREALVRQHLADVAVEVDVWGVSR